MLNVITSDEVLQIINSRFAKQEFQSESIATTESLGRVLNQDIISNEDVPGFNRSTVDGYAVYASDTFGCSESIPAVLTLQGEVLMGESAEQKLDKGSCIIVSTGGELPEGADTVVMVEDTEDYGNNMIGIQKPSAPGNNVIFKGDDVSAGDKVLSAGTILTPHDIGILSALGHSEVNVRRKPVVGIISTGDELVASPCTPKSGQVRDVNMPMLQAAVRKFGAEAKDYGLIHDDKTAIRAAVKKACESCDIVLISGGSSAGARDMTAQIIESDGEILFHGIAMKPGKPTILGIIADTPVFGLPGHPVAAYFVTELFVRPLIMRLMGAECSRYTTIARIGETLSSNHGREEYIAVKLDENWIAHPIRGKSGLIASLANVDGYICIARDCEGLAENSVVKVIYF